MKKIILIFILAINFFSFQAYAEEYIHISGEEFYNETADKIMSADLSISPTELLKSLAKNLFSELSKSKKEMIGIIIIAALSGVLQALKNAEKEDKTTEAAFFVSFLIMSIMAFNIFKITVGYGVDIIGQISDFITKLIPVLMALLVSSGKSLSAAAFHPVLAAGVYVMTVLVERLVVPLIYFSAISGIAGNISPRLQISSFTKIIRSAAKWILTVALTVFSSISAVYGFSAPVVDAVSLKTLKFAVGRFVPVVGGLLTETVETVLKGTGLLKNAVGTAGMISLFVISITPVLKIVAIVVMLKICQAAAEPFTDRRICNMIGDISDSVSLILGMVITVVMLFIIAIGIILSST